MTVQSRGSSFGFWVPISGGSRISQRTRQSYIWGRQPAIWPIFHKNCMKMKEILAQMGWGWCIVKKVTLYKNLRRIAKIWYPEHTNWYPKPKKRTHVFADLRTFEQLHPAKQKPPRKFQTLSSTSNEEQSEIEDLDISFWLNFNRVKFDPWNE